MENKNKLNLEFNDLVKQAEFLEKKTNQKLFESQKAFEKVQLAKTSEEMLDSFVTIDNANAFAQDFASTAQRLLNDTQVIFDKISPKTGKDYDRLHSVQAVEAVVRTHAGKIKGFHEQTTEKLSQLQSVDQIQKTDLEFNDLVQQSKFLEQKINKKLTDSERAFDNVKSASTAEEIYEPFATIDNANAFAQDFASTAQRLLNDTQVIFDKISPKTGKDYDRLHSVQAVEAVVRTHAERIKNYHEQTVSKINKLQEQEDQEKEVEEANPRIAELHNELNQTLSDLQDLKEVSDKKFANVEKLLSEAEKAPTEDEKIKKIADATTEVEFLNQWAERASALRLSAHGNINEISKLIGASNPIYGKYNDIYHKSVDLFKNIKNSSEESFKKTKAIASTLGDIGVEHGENK